MKEKETPEEFEARMIAQFNKRVNQPEVLLVNEDGVERNDSQEQVKSVQKVEESGGPKGLEPTRYGDWEAKGRCHDF